MRITWIVVGVLAALVLLGWLGLQIKPASFPLYPQGTAIEGTVPLPDGLPAPVERFYRQLYGEDIPLIESAVVTGRGRMRISGLTFPVRFRFTHDAGRGYRHYIEATFFRLPVMRVNEHYLEGQARLELPFGVSEGPNVDQGANLALWAESLWLPSIWITAPDVTWEPIDEETALLVVPFGEGWQRLVIRFDPETGLLHVLESMRYRGEADETKILWLNKVLQWAPVNGHKIPARCAVTWFDQGSPWFTLTVEDLVYNADVRAYVRADGP